MHCLQALFINTFILVNNFDKMIRAALYCTGSEWDNMHIRYVIDVLINSIYLKKD